MGDSDQVPSEGANPESGGEGPAQEPESETRQLPHAEADSAGDTGASDPDAAGTATEIAPPLSGGRGRKVARVTARSLLALVSVAVLAATAIGWSTFGKLSNGVSKSTVLSDVPGAPAAQDDSTDVLLVGNDSRTDAQGNPLPLSVLKQLRTESTNGLNTDTLILVRIPNHGGRPTAVSIPRDSYVDVPGGRPEKINAVYGLAKTATTEELNANGGGDPASISRQSDLAGQRALVRTVQNLTGARIDHYAEVNLLGFYEVTEAIGGVDVCLRQPTSDKDSGARFRAGRQIVAGGDALAFVRQRHGLPRGDLDRITRQQVFMASLANKVLSSGTVTDSAKLDRLMSAARKSVVLDEQWDIASFAGQMQGLASGTVTFTTLPVSNAGGRDDRGQSVVQVDPAQVRQFVAGLSGEPKPGAVAPTTQAPRMGAHGLLRLDDAARREPPETSTVDTTTSGTPEPTTTNSPTTTRTTTRTTTEEPTRTSQPTRTSDSDPTSTTKRSTTHSRTTESEESSSSTESEDTPVPVAPSEISSDGIPCVN